MFFVKKNPVLLLGILMMLTLFFIAFFGRYLPMVDEDLHTIDYIWTEDKIPLAPPYAPSANHPFGTDREGRDLLSLIVIGAKHTLLVVLLITAIRYIVAVPLGYLAHRRIKGVALLVQWLDGFLSYVPSIIIVMLLSSLPPILTTDLRPVYLVLVIAFVETGRAAQMFKFELDELSTKDFITGGNAIGASPFRLLKSYYLPYLYDKLIVNMVTDTARVMFMLGQLAFLEIFISQALTYVEPNWELLSDTAAWPNLLVNTFNDIRSATWIPFYPALAMTYAIIGFNALAQGLQNLFKSRINYY
ncbi:ABC transporter permease [Peribacillus sp. SCS-155]|uniref:ABC transporter permease n=1 Tax=Peribacillus sedimenti TaxID=3115297 RepID=UPI003906348A